jgi:hypothetical protein
LASGDLAGNLLAKDVFAGEDFAAGDFALGDFALEGLAGGDSATARCLRSRRAGLTADFLPDRERAIKPRPTALEPFICA